MPTLPTVFCAPTLLEARRAAWQWLSQSGASSLLDPPLVLGSARGFAAWRALASEGAASALALPRLVEPETYFARFHGANVRQPALRGAARLWALADVLRGLEPRFQHLDFDADDTDSLRAMAALLGRMRRQCETRLPVGDDPFGAELDEWRAAYDAHLAETGAFDTEAAPALFARNPEANRAFAFPKALLVDDLPDVSPALALGLGTLLDRAGAACATLALPNGFEDDVANRARAFWEGRSARFEWVDAPSSPRLSVARALLGDAQTPDALPDGVFLTEAHTPHDEWERIAAHVRARLDEGALPHEFCLVVPDYAAQMPLARAAFRAHGVPLPPEFPDPAASPLVQKLLRVLAARGAWSVDELHDLFGDGTLQLRWAEEDGSEKRLDAGRLRRAHRSNRGEGDEAAWCDPQAWAQIWEAELRRIHDAGGMANEARAGWLAASLDGGDLAGVARFKALLAPFTEPLGAARWAEAAIALLEGLECARKGEADALTGALQTEETAPLKQAALTTLRAGIAGVVARAGEEDVRAAGRWVAWLRVELTSVRPEEDASIPTACVRVLRVGEVGEAGKKGETEVFVPGLTERAWPARAPKSRWPAATAKALEALRAGESAPLAGALHGLARLLAGGARLHLSFPAWQNGVEVSPSPLIEDLRALFPNAAWPELALPERPTSRALWLRQLARSGAAPTDPALRALESMRRERTDAAGFGRTNGVLGERGRPLLAPLLPRDDGHLELSASGAESYARCGLRFFFERVLGLGDEERAEDDLTRAEAGDLVHKVLHHFRREWSEPLDGSTFERARAALESHVRRECARLGLPPILRRAEARRLLGTPARDGALTRILRAECREADALAAGEATTFSGAFVPLVHLQGAGGFALSVVGNGLEQAFRLPLAGVTLRGRIDRLDASPDGLALRVLDYKTGSAAALPAFHKGSDRLHFQLAIYIEAARHLAGAWQPAPDVGAAYLSPRKGFAGVAASPAFVGAKAARTALAPAVQAQWLADTRAQLERIAALIEAGTFNLSVRAPKVARCDYCAHAAMCGQNPAIQTARAAAHEDSQVVYYPAPVVW